MTALTWIELPKILLLCCAQCDYLTWPLRKLGSSCWSWADPSACQGGKENLSEQLLISKLLLVWEGSCSSRELLCTGRGRRKMLLEAEKLQVCVRAALLLCCVLRVFHTQPALGSPGCSHCWRRSFGPMCSTRVMALHHFFLSLKIYSLLFREMQHENLQNNHFLFR